MGNLCAICCRPGKETSCCCFSLAIAMLVFAGYYGAVGGMDLWQALASDPVLTTQKYNAIFTLSVAGALALSVILGLLKLGLISFIFTITVFLLLLSDAIFKLITFIFNWVEWGKALHDGTMKFQAAMVFSSISQLLTIGITLSMANVIWSAALVYKAGGNGCEYKNYEQIKASSGGGGKGKGDTEAGGDD